MDIKRLSFQIQPASPAHLVVGAVLVALIANLHFIRFFSAISRSVHNRLSEYVFRASQYLFGFGYSDEIENQHIRLIRLPDSPPKLSPSLTLHTFDLNQCPPYIALSYTWGPPRDTSSCSSDAQNIIRLNGKPFPVLPNLYGALSQLCVSRPGQYLWVDGICINQKNTAEQSSQVAIMDYIYNGAVETAIWLGLATDKTARAVEIAREIAKGAEAKIIEWGRAQSYGDVFIADNPDLLMKNGLPPLTAKDWTVLEDIYTRAWFGRVWMLQEVALSRNATVLIGHHEVPWDVIGDAAGLINMSGALLGLFAVGTGLQSVPLVQALVHASGLHITRQWSLGKDSRYQAILSSTDYSVGIHTGQPKRLLLELLLTSHGFKATVRRDRIYSLLGIANYMERTQGRPRLNLKVDYKSSDKVVLTELGISLLQETQSLHLLSLAGFASRSVSSDLASWIPYFDTTLGPVLGPSYTNLRPFDASAGARPDFAIDKTLHELHVKAISPHLGTIEELGEPWHEIYNGHFNSIFKILLHCGTTYAPTDQPIVEAFWRTLIMDSDMARRPAPSRLAAAFSAWIIMITICGLSANRLANPFIIDQFEDLEPLWTLANTRDSTNTLPKTSDMIPLLFKSGLRSDPTVPVMAESEKQAMFASWGKAAAPFEALLRITLVANRRFARTVRGYLCLVPLQAKIGDKVMIIAGCPTPLILRRTRPSSDSYFQLVGDTYVHGAMFGEHVAGQFSWRDICLV
ncbi:hypothetical protein F66182_5650 [Fusarium sp. NRRL 66182]|nr:hypothetical protein F66182_5650 [Fusarium sp. NRRL 66182]